MLLLVGCADQARAQPEGPGIGTVFAAADFDRERAEAAQAELAASWNDGYAAMLVDLLDLLRRTSLIDPRAWVRVTKLAGFLEAQTGQSLGMDANAWQHWLWARDYGPHPDYETFKGLLFAQLDPRFEEFFGVPGRTAIRLDEIQWGGVRVNGIPPLEYPRVLPAGDADYLEDDNIVFGIALGREARAYPKRILAWHEMARDRLGGHELTIVYCTLCGTVIPYDSFIANTTMHFGTSGLLYRSNKLMFDEGTKSLWSSLTGTPVVGPLVGAGLELATFPVVTTTWGEWRRRHPDTTVLSLETGFSRDYSEGAAYRQYFATDALMFDVPALDPRLRNKDEILALRARTAAGEEQTLAISASLLLQEPVYELEFAGRSLLIVTTPNGANRVYAAGAERFVAYDSSAGRVTDRDDRAWRVTEDALEATFDADTRLPRVPAHRAFWFGWFAQHPGTQLIR